MCVHASLEKGTNIAFFTRQGHIHTHTGRYAWSSCANACIRACDAILRNMLQTVIFEYRHVFVCFCVFVFVGPF
jgi:hypothetical protein